MCATNRKWKYGHRIKSHQLEIKPVEKIVFIMKFCLVTYLDFLHALVIHDGASNKKVSGKVIWYNFLLTIKCPFSMHLKFYWITFCQTRSEVKEFREISNKEIKRLVTDLVFQIIFKHWNLEGLFVDLACCHGNRYDVISSLKVLPNNRVTKLFIVCLHYEIFFFGILRCFTNTSYSNEKPLTFSVLIKTED